MLSQAVSTTAPSRLELAMSAASAICTMPAVATVDWCHRAAAILRTLRPGSLACVVIGTVAHRGTMIQLEATGGAGIDPMGRTIELDHVHPDNAGSLGWWFEDAAPPGACRVAALADLPCAVSWHDSLAGRAWGRLGVRDLIVGSSSMPGDVPARRLIVELGTRAGGRAAVPEELELVRAVMPLLAQRASLVFGVGVSSPLNRLTQREQQVLDHLALGKSVKQIATDLARSPHTVHDHVKALHRKLNASSRGELIARALGHLSGSSHRGHDAESPVSGAAAQRLGVISERLLSA